ncbi:hypothetical protein ACHQM5_027531 [Ranunculus cassubicifolius]
MLSGTIVQTCILFSMTYRTNWNKEASEAGVRIKRWGQDAKDKAGDIEKKHAYLQ